MQQTEKNIFNYAFKLIESIITSVDRKDKGLIIRLDSVKVFKYSGKIDFGIEETVFSSAEIHLNSSILYGEEPEYPAQILDISLVLDGQIYGNYIDYPLVVGGEIQLVIIFASHNKLTIRANKMYIILKELDETKYEVQ